MNRLIIAKSLQGIATTRKIYLTIARRVTRADEFLSIQIFDIVLGENVKIYTSYPQNSR